MPDSLLRLLLLLLHIPCIRLHPDSFKSSCCRSKPFCPLLQQFNLVSCIHHSVGNTFRLCIWPVCIEPWWWEQALVGLAWPVCYQALVAGMDPGWPVVKPPLARKLIIVPFHMHSTHCHISTHNKNSCALKGGMRPRTLTSRPP